MWGYFEKSEGGGNCKVCKCFVKTSGNTTNLNNHLKRKHPSVFNKIKMYTKTTTKTKSSHLSQLQSKSEDIDNPDIPDNFKDEMLEELAENIISTAS